MGSLLHHVDLSLWHTDSLSCGSQSLECIGTVVAVHGLSCSVVCGLSRWLSGKESACQYRRHRNAGSIPGLGKIPWRRKWQPTPVFLLGKSHGQRILAGYSSWVTKMKVKVAQSCPAFLGPCGLYNPWNSPGQNTGVGSLSLFQGIFPNPGIKPRSLQLNHKGSQSDLI